MIIAAGSRPSSPLDDDPSVTCSDNPYPRRCQHYNQAMLSIERDYNSSYLIQEGTMLRPIHAARLACTDFYNRSDNGLLWWQALQREAVFIPKMGHISRASEDECPEDSVINFYINEEADTKRQYVDWTRGHRLSHLYEGRLPIVFTCFSTSSPQHNQDEKYIVNIQYTFLHCLFEYGEGLKKYLPVDTSNN